MIMKTFALLFCTPVLVFSAVAQAPAKPKPTFEEALLAARTPLTIVDGKLAGLGADLLAQAVASSRFVLLGEDHITREIPVFAAALCDLMHPDAYVVEAGPYATQYVDGLLRAPDRAARMAEHVQRYPEDMAFLNIRQENEMAAHCAAADPGLHLWGVDQEFLGAAEFLLHAMAETQNGPRATAAIAEARTAAHAAEVLALATGDPMKTWLLAAKPSEISVLQDAVNADGTAVTSDLLKELVASRAIYLRGDSEANHQRALLMKQHFLSRYRPLKAANPNARVLFKFGDVHLEKGYNALNQRDLGNLVAEMADAEQTQSLHLFLYGAKGMHSLFGGYGKPMKQEAFVLNDTPDDWTNVAVAGLYPQQPGAKGTVYTIYDLRKLRFKRLDLPQRWRQLVFSYDLFVLAPETTAAEKIR
jgi:hypothetical protein